MTLKAAVGQGLRFTRAQVLPGRGMMLYQAWAKLPGRGEVAVLAAPPLAEGLARLSGGPGDEHGNGAFALGGAFLAPFVNRIRGRLSPDGREIETLVAGRRVTLAANWGGKAPGAERYAMHGLILDRAAGDVTTQAIAGGEAATARLEAGDFGARWPARTAFDFRIALTSEALAVCMTARNVGDEPLPMGLGWHPYFNLPSGDRAQARLRVPATTRLAVNDYDEVLPTGEAIPVAGTGYDFRGGRALGDLYLDDCFAGLETTAAGETVCEVVDPAAAYGVRIASPSPAIRAIQTFAPPDRPFVVVEPQTAFADPYGAEWGGRETGMALLRPGEALEYAVTLSLFTP